MTVKGFSNVAILSQSNKYNRINFPHRKTSPNITTLQIATESSDISQPAKVPVFPPPLAQLGLVNLRKRLPAGFFFLFLSPDH